jgi:hypothetical protein
MRNQRHARQRHAPAEQAAAAAANRDRGYTAPKQTVSAAASRAGQEKTPKAEPTTVGSSGLFAIRSPNLVRSDH